MIDDEVKEAVKEIVGGGIPEGSTMKGVRLLIENKINGTFSDEKWKGEIRPYVQRVVNGTDGQDSAETTTTTTTTTTTQKNQRSSQPYDRAINYLLLLFF
jgi:hypothetical protein